MPGAIIVVRHTVEDWEQWVEAFKDHAGMRAEYGSRGADLSPLDRSTSWANIG